MDAATITAVCTGGVAVITAVTALIRQFQHENTPHPADPPAGGSLPVTPSVTVSPAVPHVTPVTPPEPPGPSFPVIPPSGP